MDQLIKVFATGPLPKQVKEKLARFAELKSWEEPFAINPEQLLDQIKDRTAVVCLLGDKMTAEVMDAAPELKLIANVAVGFDNIDIAHARKRGILVVNTPGVLDNATADLAFGLLLACARRIVEADKYVRNHQWTGWRTDLMLGSDLTGKTLGIVGMGRIGEAMARRGLGFGMKIIYTRKGNEDKDHRIQRDLAARRVSLPELISSSDFISVHCPLNHETKNLIGKVELSRVKKHCVLINTARGAVVDQKALIAALQDGNLAGAGLDVFDDEPQVPEELMALSNVVVVPHIGSATYETRTAMAQLAVDGLISAFTKRMPENVVNKDVWPVFTERMKVATS
ncbi:MAG TPA: D-glycerate dehydrogenase [Drouetiella sp.]